MARITFTLLGLALVATVPASEAQAGLFDWLGFGPGYHAPRVAGPYMAPSYGRASGYSPCGPNGCAPCVNGQCGTGVRTIVPSGYSVQAPAYYPSTTYPVSTMPVRAYPSTTYPVSTYPVGSYTAPCTTGNCPTAPYGSVPYNAGSSPNLSSSPYYGSY
jgi:hypothetical protein